MRACTPCIDSIARDGLLFEQTISQAPYTSASHASILTGMNPYNHGIRGIIGYKLSDKVTTLAEILRAHNYQTGAVVGSDALNSRYGLDRGFDLYDQEFLPAANSCWILGFRRTGKEVTDRALKWLKKTKDNPFFLFLHYFDAHDEMSDIKGLETLSDIKKNLGAFKKWVGSRFFSKGIKRYYRRVFHGQKKYGIRYQLERVSKIDHQIGRLVDFLKKQELYDQTYLFVLSDHGDSFWEHGERSHREYLYDTTLKIPFILKGPAEFEGKKFSFLTRAVDVYPTVLELLGIAAEKVDGKGLLQFLIKGKKKELHAYSETRHEISPDNFDELRSNLVSLRTAEWKLILDRLNDRHQLYDLVNDPKERKNVWSKKKDIAAELEEELVVMIGDSDALDENYMSPEELKRVEEALRRLGYL
jgi:arylsulfatase A-like enzyme